MAIHDWRRVDAGTWHAFQLAWIAEIQNALNNGLLPPDYYAMAEQIIGPLGPLGPDVLTLQEVSKDNEASEVEAGGVAVKAQPPKTRMVIETDIDNYLPKRRTLAIRHASNDRIVRGSR